MSLGRIHLFTGQGIQNDELIWFVCSISQIRTFGEEVEQRPKAEVICNYLC